MAITFSCCYGNPVILLSLTTSDLFPWIQLVAPSNKQTNSFIHSDGHCLFPLVTGYLHAFISSCLYLGQICVSSVCLFVSNHLDIYVMCATQEDDVLPRWRYASEDVNLFSRNSAHGHQPKGGQSCVDGA